MSPLKATISALATTARNITPLENTNRAPRLKNWRGRKPSFATIDAKPGEVGVGGVGGEDQDHEGADHRQPEHDALAAVEVLGHQPEAVAVVLPTERLEVAGEHGHAEEARAQDPAHPHQRVRGVLALGLRNAGTPFETASTPESATAPDEKARSSIIRLSDFIALANLAALLAEQLDRDRADVLHVDPIQPVPIRMISMAM